MAGAGYNLFTTGSVLTAAQVNTFLQEQTVMRFANAAARTTALASVLAEGMVSYLQDTDAVEVYNGTSWVGIASGDITAVTAGTGISGGGTSGAVTITNAMATEITASGDIIVGTGSGTFDNLPIGSTGQVLTADTTVSPYKVKWATPSGGGKVVQIVSASYATQTATASTSFSDTGLTATITPASSSNKILVLVSLNGCGKSTGNCGLNTQLLRGATVIAKLGEDDGFNNNTNANFVGSISSAYMDSPATTSATTYKVQLSNSAGVGSAVVQNASGRSTIQLIEVTP